MFSKVLRIFSNEGAMQLGKRGIGFLYRSTIRRLLPTVGPVLYSGIPIAMSRKWGDLTIPKFMAPYMGYDIPEYEATLIHAIQSNVRCGDKVVVVGGGEGVTVTVAAKAVGDTGSVICYEGGESYVNSVNRTTKINGVAERVTVNHAIVGERVYVYGDHEAGKPSKLLSPDELPDCDVLELDCEGAEIVILENMKISPRTILVETHGVHGAPAEAVRRILEARHYTVSDLGWAEPELAEECRARDIKS